MTDNPLNIDDIFQLVTIDRHRKVKISIKLISDDGDEVPIEETVKKMTKYIDDKIKDTKENECKSTIVPLMAQSMVGGLDELLGTYHTAALLSQENLRYSFMHMMTVSFYLVKWIQKNNIKIHTVEDELTDSEMQRYDRINQATNASIAASCLGVDSRRVLREMLKTGKVTREDLESMGYTEIDDLDEDSSVGENAN